MKFDCPALFEIELWLDGQYSAELAPTIAKHLAACPKCNTFYKYSRAVRLALAETRKEEETI